MLNTRILSSLLGVAVAAAALVACTPETPRFALKHAEQRGRLEGNGLRFVIMPDPTTQLVEVDVRYNVGSKEDPPGKAGLAHVVEHMMFQLKPDGAESPPLMHFVNQSSTFFNAYTSWDTTHYMTTARAEQMDSLLKIEAMRLYYGCQTVSEEEFLREREVVRNEIRQRGGTAEGQIPQLVMSSIYPKGHAYERMIGGDDAQLTTLTLQDTCEFIKKYYTPENATVIIAGGITIEDATAGLTKWFGKLEKRPTAPHVPVKPVNVEKKETEIALDIERPVLAVTWALPPGNSPEGERVQTGINTAFFRTARAAQEYDFANYVQPAILGGEEAPIFSMIIELKDASKKGEALDFVWKAARSAHRGWDEGSYLELEELKNREKASFITAIEDLSSRTNLLGDMVQFDKSFDFDSSGLYLFHALDKIDQFDGRQIGRDVKKSLDPDRARVVFFKPNSETGIKGDKRAKVKFETKSHDRKEVPEVDPREAKRPLKVAGELKSLANATRFTLDNGMKVVLLPTNGMPIVQAELHFSAGTSANENPALGEIAASTLSLPLDAEAMGRTGVDAYCRAGTDTTTCESRAVSIYLDVMLKALDRLVRIGEYNQEGLERLQKRIRSSMTAKTSQEQTEFERQFRLALYGSNHPYGRITTLDHYNALSKSALDDFRSKFYVASNATLIIAGDIDIAKAEKLARSTFGGWGKGSAAAKIDPTPFQRTGPAHIGVIGKESPQLNIAIGFPAPAGVDGQEGARRVLAGMINQRMGDLRFKLGSTYGVYAGRSPSLGPGSYTMGGTVDAERGGESLKAMRDGIDMMRRGENFDIDFVRARRELVQNLLGESTVTYALAGRLAFIAKYGVDVNFYNTLLQQIAAASPAQVKALIASELNPNNEVVIVLGDKAHLESAFNGAGLADRKFVEPSIK